MYSVQVVGRDSGCVGLMTVADYDTDSVAGLLVKAGFEHAILSINTCSKGGNNRAYRVETSHDVFAVKKYFRHESDVRDRLATEFKFLVYADQVAPGFAPKPYVKDDENGFALYEFVDGEAFEPGKVDAAEIKRAAEFFRALNQRKAKAKPHDLPFASEACFSIQNHIDLIGRRLNGLTEIVVGDEEDQQLKTLVQKLQTCWRAMVAELLELARAAKLSVDENLDESQRCVSPSDFGFHNALRGIDGSIRFLDFEYAGKDDPAKMAGDFFAQLAIPIPGALFGDFVENCFAPLPWADSLIRRAHLLRPLYRFKWCCIALNVFLPASIARRKFANPGLDVTAVKRAQLAKADKIYQSLEK